MEGILLKLILLLMLAISIIDNIAIRQLQRIVGKLQTDLSIYRVALNILNEKVEKGEHGTSKRKSKAVESRKAK